MGSIAAVFPALAAAALAENGLEDVPNRAGRQRPLVGPTHMSEDGRLAHRVEHRPLAPVLDAPDRQREDGALIEQL